MTTRDIVDPVVAEADRRVERAKASLRSRLELLEQRLVDVRDRLDLPEHIRRHPWPAIGIALALGALAGGALAGDTHGARAALGPPGDRALGRSALRMVGRLGLRIIRELALAQLGLTARRWLEHNAAWSDAAWPDEVDPRAGVPASERYPAP